MGPSTLWVMVWLLGGVDKKAWKGTGQGDVGPMYRRFHVFYSLVRNGFY